MRIEDLTEHLLVQDGREMLQVGLVHSANEVTAQVVYPLASHAAVRRYNAAAVDGWASPSKSMLRRYQDAQHQQPARTNRRARFTAPSA